MRLKLAIVAVFFVIAGFGMVHSPSVILEYISITLMGLGTSYLVFVILTSKNNHSKEKD